jgi:hypothetical protein
MLAGSFVCEKCGALLDPHERIVARTPTGARVMSLADALGAGEILGPAVELLHPDCFLDVVSPPRLDGIQVASAPNQP